MSIEVETAQAYLERAEYAVSSGHGALARTLLRRAVKAAPGDQRLWTLLGSITPEKAEALDCYRRALEINPYNVQALAGLAQLKSTGEASPDKPDWGSRRSRLRLAATRKRQALLRPTLTIQAVKDLSPVQSEPEPTMSEPPISPAEPPNTSTARSNPPPASPSAAAIEKTTTPGLKNSARAAPVIKTMPSSRRRQNDSLGLLIVADALFVVGGILVIVGSGLPWFRLQGNEESYTWIGYQGSGQLSVMLGVITFLLIAIGLMRGRLGILIASLVLFTGCGVLTVIAASSLWFVQQIVQAPIESTALLFSLDPTQSHFPGIGWGLVGVTLGGLLLMLGGLLHVRFMK